MKALFSILICLITILNIYGQTDDDYSIIIDSLIATESYDEIITYFEKEDKKHPNNNIILRALAYSYTEKEDFEKGEKLYLKAINLDSECITCYNNLGKLYMRMNKIEMARKSFLKTIELEPENSEGYILMSMLEESNGDNVKALEYIDKVIDLSPDSAIYYFYRAEYYVRQNYNSIAMNDLYKCIELDPNLYESYYLKSNIYYNQGHMAKSLIEINKAIIINNEDPKLFYSRGVVHQTLGNFDLSIEDLTKAISIDSENHLLYTTRSYSYYYKEEMDSSCNDNNIALDLLLAEENSDNQLTIDEVKTFLDKTCDDSKPSYYYQRGIAEYNKSNFEKSAEHYKKGLRKYPNNGMILSFFGNTLLKLDEYAESLQLYRKSLENIPSLMEEVKSNPNYTGLNDEEVRLYELDILAQTYSSMSECEIGLGRIDAALENINKCIGICKVDISSPQAETYYNLRGYIYLLKEDYGNAMINFEKSLKINSENSLAIIFRAISKVSNSNVSKTKTVAIYSRYQNFDSKPYTFNWEIPSKNKVKKHEKILRSAINDCDRAIKIQANSEDIRVRFNIGYAYYIKAQIKMMLGEDHCEDFNKADINGVEVPDEFYIGCP